jgi:signal peptidase I
MRTNSYGFDPPNPAAEAGTPVAVAVLTPPPSPVAPETQIPAPSVAPFVEPAPIPMTSFAPFATHGSVLEALPADELPRTDEQLDGTTPRTGPSSTGQPASRLRRGLRGVRAFVLSGVLGVAVATVLVFLGSIPLGYRSLTVMSGSMEPTIGVGDVVMERQVPPFDVHVGDIVTFRDPNEQSTLITHRVRSLKVHDGAVDFVTKGDANNTVERWTIPIDGRLGLVALHVPKVGYALVWASGKTGRIALIAIPGLILGVLELRRIWRPRRSEA